MTSNKPFPSKKIIRILTALEYIATFVGFVLFGVTCILKSYEVWVICEYFVSLHGHSLNLCLFMIDPIGSFLCMYDIELCGTYSRTSQIQSIKIL